MKYFLDTEFIEGTQKDTRLRIAYLVILSLSSSYSVFCYTYDYIISASAFGLLFIISTYFYNISKKVTKPTIDLISIGIVSEDGREFYAISKDFNLKEAWNRYQINTKIVVHSREGISQYSEEKQVKEYWIRDNILKPIFNELIQKEKGAAYKALTLGISIKVKDEFTYKNFKRLINKYGKTNKEVAKEVIAFAQGDSIERTNPTFYTYYGAYDWVVFCWLFGKMIDLPKGFPMFSKDLKVMLDDKVNSLDSVENNQRAHCYRFETKLIAIKEMKSYPTQDNCHNALDDAKWNKNLYNFINTL